LRWIGKGANLARLVLRHGLPGAIVYHGDAPGDDLLCTAVLHELRVRGRRRLWIVSRHPELFECNDDVHAVISRSPWLPAVARRLGWEVFHAVYNSYNEDEDRDVVDPDRHIIAVMCRNAGLVGPINLRPYLNITADERAKGRIVEQQIVIQSSGIGAAYPMITKQWYPERFASVVASLREQYNFVQLGSPTDPLLEGALDLRGRTNFRESAAILAQSLLFVGNVGFLMHLARAVECRSVILYGGREAPKQSGYSCNENLFTPLSCSPCWLRNTCPYDRDCMKRIVPTDVTTAIARQVLRKDEPLALDSCILGELSPN
jgi:hypothetical protein